MEKNEVNVKLVKSNFGNIAIISPLRKVVSTSFCLDVLFVMGICIISIIVFKNTSYIQSLDGDVAAYNYSHLAEMARALNNNEFPLWRNNLMGGMPTVHYFSQEFYPIALILVKVFFNEELNLLPFSVLTVYLCIHFIIFAVGMYVVGRVLKWNHLSCFLTAVLVGFSQLSLSFLSSHIFIAAIAWSPLLIATIIKLINNEKNYLKYVCISGVIIATIILGSSSQGGLLSLIPFFMIYIIYVLLNFKDIQKVLLITKKFLFSGLIGVGLASVKLVSLGIFLKNSIQYIPGFGYVYPTDDINLANVIKHPRNSSFSDSLVGIGWTAIVIVIIILFIVGMFAKIPKDKNRFIYIFGKIYTSITFFLTMGLFGFHLILSYIPFVNKIRELYLYQMVISVGLFIVIGLGIQTLLVYANKKSAKLSDLFYNVVLMFSLIFFYTLIQFTAQPINKYDIIFIVMLLVIAALLYWSKYQCNKWKIIRKILLPTMILIMVVVNTFAIHEFMSLRPFTSQEADDRIIMLKENIETIYQKTKFPTEENPFRILTWGETVYPSAAMGILGYYDAFTYWNPSYKKIIEIHNGVPNEKKVVMQNIEYMVVPENTVQGYMNRGWLFVEEISGIMSSISNISDEKLKTAYLVHHPDVQGPAWMVYDYDLYSQEATLEDLLAKIKDPSFFPHKKALVKDSGNITNNLSTIVESKEINNSVKMTEYNFNNMTLSVETDSPGILVMAEREYPGWRVYVDGIKKDVLEINYGQRGVFLEAGTHIVEFKFQPTSLYIGIGISSATVIAMLLMIGFSYVKIKKRKKQIIGSSYENIEILSGIHSDYWMEKEANFRIETKKKGKMTLCGYAPFAMSGNETGRVFVNGSEVLSYNLSDYNGPFVFKINNLPHNSMIDVEIKNDFTSASTVNEIRELTFVLTYVYCE